MDEISPSTHAAAARSPNRERRSRLNLELQAMIFEDELTNSSEEEGDLDQDWKRQSRGRAGNGRKTHKGFSTPPPKRTQLASPSLSSPVKLAVTFGGKVYRTLDQSSGAQYSSSGNFFGEPDEEVGDAEADRQAERKEELERRMMVKMGKKRVCSDNDEDDDDDLQVVIQPPSVLGNNTPHKFRPLATPPSSSPTRQNVATTPTSSLGNPFEPAQVFPTFSSDRLLPPLHSSLTSLLALHVSLESTLIFHLANEGSRVASSKWKLNAAGEATIRLENLITLPNLAKLLATDGKTLGERELSRLLWVWEGCGMKENVDELDFEEEGPGKKDIGGMGFIVTQTRYKALKTIVNCYGIGISISIKSNPQLPQFELIAPPGSPSRRSAIEKKNAPPSPSSIGRGREGMSVVALWSAGKSDRSAAFAARLRQWADRCEAEEKKKSTNQLPTPKRSRPNSPLESLSSPQPSLSPQVFHLPPIPQAILPVLSCAISRVEGTSSPSPKRKTPIDVFGPAVPISTGGGKIAMLLEGKKVKVSTLSKGDQRMQDMRDRLNAKSDAKKSPYQASLAELSQGVRVKKSLGRVKEIGVTYTMVASERYKRNSMLSRLGDVADVVWMLFDVGKRSMTMMDVASKVANSSKIPVSTDETIASLHLLCEVCPEYAYLKSVSGQDWLCMKGLITLKEAKEIVKEELARSTSA